MLVENLSLPFDRRVWKECCALRDAGFEVTAISPKGRDLDSLFVERVNGVTIYRYVPYESTGGAISYAMEFAVALVSMTVLAWVVFLRRGFHLIHLSNPPDILILAVLPFKLLGKRVIFDQHDLSPEIYSLQQRNRERDVVHRLLLAFEWLTYRCADVVICITKSVCEIARTRGRVPSERLFLVRNGPDLRSFEGAQADDTLRRGKRFLLSYVGMMGPQDGVDLLLRAIKVLKEDFRRDDFHVHLVGGGTELGRLTDYARELGVAEHVTFAGRQQYDGVVRAIASADVCLCPDPKTPMNDRANFVKVTEYMCLGRPIVAFDLSEVRYSAEDAALYATPNDERDFAAKVDFLLSNPDERVRRGRLGAQRVRDFLTWDHSKEALYAAYSCALGESLHPPAPVPATERAAGQWFQR